MTGVVLKNVTKNFGATQVIRGVDIKIDAGEFCVFVGPSGCGKSTLLRLIAGLEDVTSGTVEIDGETVNDLEPIERGTAMVFQNYALYPHMSVAENMGFGLRMNGVRKDKVAQRVIEAARILQIDGLLDRKPKQLSGGQRQRVAIGRAIVRDPKVFLFDEPLSNLDAELRVATRLEIARLHRQLGRATMVYVTHDQVEAMTLADRIVVLRDGRVEQSGTPLELYETPANVFVAGFIGSPRMTLIALDKGAAGANLPDGRDLPLTGEDSDRVTTLGVRADGLVPMTSGAAFEAEVSVVEHLGDVVYVYARTGWGQDVVARFAPGQAVAVGEKIGFGFDEKIHFFGSDGNRLANVRLAPSVSQGRP